MNARCHNTHSSSDLYLSSFISVHITFWIVCLFPYSTFIRSHKEATKDIESFWCLQFRKQYGNVYMAGVRLFFFMSSLSSAFFLFDISVISSTQRLKDIGLYKYNKATHTSTTTFLTQKSTKIFSRFSNVRLKFLTHIVFFFAKFRGKLELRMSDYWDFLA